MKQLVQHPVTFSINELKPVMNEYSFDLHYNHVYRKHVQDFNDGKGDHAFNKAGAFLHSLYFENIRDYRDENLPVGKSRQIIEMRYGTWSRFIDTLLEQANRLQGNGWLFMNTAGYINIIPNNRIVDNVALVIDLWEHAYLLTHNNNREEYLKQHLNIINWDVVNERILKPKEDR